MRKNSKNEPGLHAFTRMNFLYQASLLISDKSPLANYYGKLVKDISKKTVEKVHPDVKRTLCKACSFPLLTQADSLDVKLKSSKNKKLKRRLKKNNCKKINRTIDDNETIEKYRKTRIDARNKKPNRLQWMCNHCGFSTCTLQRPTHKLWINEDASKM